MSFLPFVMEWLVAGGSLLTMVFGVYGLGIKTRDDTNKLTPRGKVVLSGIVLSGLIAFTTNTWQILAKRTAAERENARFSRLLSSVERTTYATKDGLITAEYVISLDKPEFVQYAKRLHDFYRTRTQVCGNPRDENDDVLNCGDYQWVISKLFEMDHLSFDLKSSLAPDMTSEWIAHQVLRYSGPALIVDEGRGRVDWKGSEKLIAAFPIDISDKVTFLYSGTPALLVRIVNVPLAAVGADNVSITSLTDMLGRTIRTSGVWHRSGCSPDPRTRDGKCMMSLMQNSIWIKRFALQFPHGVSIELVDYRHEVTTKEGDRYLAKTIADDPVKLGE